MMKAKRVKIFRNFLISYICVIIIPILLGFLIYDQSVRIIKKNAEQNNLERLEQTREAFEINLNKAEMVLTQISLNPYVVDFMYNQKSELTDTVYKLKQLTLSLSSYYFFDDFILSYYILFPGSDYVVTKDEVYTTKAFFQSFFAAGGYDYGQWLAEQSHKTPYMGFYKASDMKLNGSLKRVYEYTVSIPYASAKKSLGSIHVLIDERNVEKLMWHSEGTEHIFSYIADSDGDLISFFSGKGAEPKALELPKDRKDGYFTMRADSRTLLVCYTYSSDRKWVFVSAQSLDELLKQVNQTKKLFTGSILLTSLLALALSFLFSYRTSRPLVKILNSLDEYGGHSPKSPGGGLLYIQKSVLSLIGENRGIRDEINRQRPVLKNVFLSRLLRGEISNSAEIESNARQFGVGTDSRRFLVALAYLGGLGDGYSGKIFDELNAAKAALSEMVGSMEPDVRFTGVDMNESTIAYISEFPSGSGDDPVEYDRTFFKRIQAEMYQKYRCNIMFTMGKAVERLSELHYSYETARYALENSTLRGEYSGIRIYNPSMRQKSRFDYPVEAELRLISLARSGRIQEIRSVLSGIFSNNMNGELYDNESLKLLLNALKNTLFRLNGVLFSNEPGIYARIDGRIIALNHLELEEVLSVYDDICIEIKRMQTNQKQNLKEEMIKFVQNNYMRQDFYLGSVTDHFKLSDTCLSLFFKENMGENFITYVEKLRMNRACDLLGEGGASVEEIARSIGYNSAHAFRRAFKRRFGITPVEYKTCAEKKSMRNEV